MTKKAYIQPATKVVSIQQQSIICTSTTEGVNKQLQNGTLSSAWSRQSDSNWDDDELTDEDEVW